MADPPRYPDSTGDTGDDADLGPARRPTTGIPRWVKVFGIIAIVLVLLFVILLLVGGNHSPGRHMSDGRAGNTPPPSVTEFAGGHMAAEGPTP